MRWNVEDMRKQDKGTNAYYDFNEAKVGNKVYSRINSKNTKSIASY